MKKIIILVILAISSIQAQCQLGYSVKEKYDNFGSYGELILENHAEDIQRLDFTIYLYNRDYRSYEISYKVLNNLNFKKNTRRTLKLYVELFSCYEILFVEITKIYFKDGEVIRPAELNPKNFIPTKKYLRNGRN